MSNTTEYIGYCEVCGLLDHHLLGGVCPSCQSKVQTYQGHDYEGITLGAEADVSYSLSSHPIRSAKQHEVPDSMGYTPYFLLNQAT